MFLKKKIYNIYKILIIPETKFIDRDYSYNGKAYISLGIKDDNYLYFRNDNFVHKYCSKSNIRTAIIRFNVKIIK